MSAALCLPPLSLTTTVSSSPPATAWTTSIMITPPAENTTTSNETRPLTSPLHADGATLHTPTLTKATTLPINYSTSSSSLTESSSISPYLSPTSTQNGPLLAPVTLSASNNAMLTHYAAVCAERDGLLMKLEEYKLALTHHYPTTQTSTSNHLSLNINTDLTSPSNKTTTSYNSTTPHTATTTSSTDTASGPSTTALIQQHYDTQHLHALHQQIHANINDYKNNVIHLLHTQENDIIRAFRRSLAEVRSALEQERKRAESGSAEWVNKCTKLSEELKWLKNTTDELTVANKALRVENQKQKKKIQIQEEDREFLIQQLVAVKKENSKIRHQYETLLLQQQQSQQQQQQQTQQQQPPYSAQGDRKHWLMEKEEKTVALK